MKGFKRIERTTALFMAVFLLISSFAGSIPAFGTETGTGEIYLEPEQATGETVTSSAIALPMAEPDGETVVEWKLTNIDYQHPKAQEPATGGVNKQGAFLSNFKNSGTGSAQKDNISLSGWASGAGTKYWQISFSSKDFENIALTAKQWSTSNTTASGPKDFIIQYSTDGINFTDVTGSEYTIGTSQSSIGIIALPEAAWDTDMLYVRFMMNSNISIAGGAVNTNAMSSIKDIVVTGTPAGSEEPETDKAVLTAAITSAQAKHDAAVVGTEPGQYPEAAKTALAAAIAAAKTVRDNEAATQTQVDAAVAALNAAVEAFEDAEIKEDTPDGDPISDAMVSENGAITVKEAATKQNGQSYKVIGQVAYMYEKSDSYGNASIIIQDIIDGEVYGFMIYRGTHAGLEPGDIITAQGSQNIYYNLPEMGAGSTITKVGHADPIPAQELTISEINANGLTKYMSEYVHIKDVTLGAFGGDHTYINDATGTVEVYKSPAFPSGVAARTKVNVSAAVSRFNSTIELRMGESSDYAIIDNGEVSKDVLIAAITSAQAKHDAAVVGTEPGQYPQAAKTAFANAIAAAKAVRDNTSATQSQVNIAVETLNAAVNTFESSKIGEDTPGDPITDAMVSANGAITVKEAAAKQNGQTYKVIGQVAYMYEKSDSYGNASIIIQDIINGEVYGFMIYRGEHAGLEPGDIITAEGSQNIYYNLPEMGQGSTITKIGHADPIPAQELTISEINANALTKYMSEYIKIKDVTLGDFGGDDTYISDGTGTVLVYKSPAYPSGATKGTIVDVFTAVSRWNSKIELRMGESSDYVIKSGVNQPPVINTVKLSNAAIGKDYPVSLNVTDDKGVASVSVNYAVNGGSFKSLNLSLNAGTGKYEATIPAAEINAAGVIKINARAVDSDSKATEKSFDVVIAESSQLKDPIPDSEPGERGVLDINQALATPIGQNIKVMGQVTYSYAGSAFLIQDIIDGSVVGYQLYAPPENLEIGDVIIAEGKAADFYTLPELGNIDSIQFVREEEAMAPQVVTISQLMSSTAYVNQYVRINNVTLGAWSDNITNVTDNAGQSVGIYKAAEYPIGTRAGDMVDLLAAGSIHSNSMQLRTNSPKDYIIKNDTMAPVITVDELLPAKVGVDYSFSVEVEDNVDVAEVKLAYTIGGTTREITLELNEINRKYQGVIPGEQITGAVYMTLSFTATDVNGNTTSQPVTANVEILDKPQIESVEPAANSSYLAGRRPEFKVTLQNAGNNPEVKLSVNGAEAVDMTVAGNVATWTPAEDLPEGEIAAEVTVTREDGVVSDPYAWSFYIGERDHNFYFGQIHSHSNYSDGAGTPEEAVAYASNAEQIDWYALTDHSNYFDTTGNLGSFDDENSGSQMTVNGQAISKWKNYKNIVEGATTDDFLAIYGFEMTWANTAYGHINTYNTEGFVSRNSSYYNATGGIGLQAYYEALSDMDTDTTFSQFNHPGTTFGNFSNFAYYDPEYDKAIDLIEVGNGDGPVHSSSYWPSYDEYPKALDKGWHLAPSNNQDNHRKHWGDANTARTVAVAESLDKDSIIRAVKNLSVYATEDNDFEVFYTVNGMPMGTISDSSPEKLEFIVDFNDPDASDSLRSVTVRGTSGNSVYVENPGNNQGRLEFEISNENPYYYLDIIQADGDRIVTAPVWVEPYETIDAGISKVKKNTEKEYLGKPVTLTTTIYNNEASEMKITKISYKFLGEVLGEKTENLPTVGSNSTVTDTFEFVPAHVGKNPVMVEVTGIINGTEKIFSSEIGLDVKLSEDELEVTDISEVQKAEEGKPFAIEGYLTSNASGYDKNIAFFDSAYIQDTTGGINIFPISGDYHVGQKLRIEGLTGSYQGEHQLNIVEEITVLDEAEHVYEPAPTAIADVPANLGKLIQVTGTVDSVKESDGLIEEIVLKDGEGNTIRVFMDGYIGGTLEDGTTADVNHYPMPEIKAGDTVTAAGLSSIDTDGNRIRVRDRAEITVGTVTDGITAELENVSAFAGDDAEVKLTLKNLKDVGGIDLEISYDAQKLTFKNLVLSEELTGVTKTDVPGKIRIIALSAQGITMEQLDAAVITFTVKPDASGIVPVTLVNASAFDKDKADIDVEKVSGSVEVKPSLPYATDVTFTGEAVVGELLEAKYIFNDAKDREPGTHIFRWLISSDGVNFAPIEGEVYNTLRVKPEYADKMIQVEITVRTVDGVTGNPVTGDNGRNAVVRRGDVFKTGVAEKDEFVDSKDAHEILEYTVELVDLDEQLTVAADYDDNGTVDVQDVISILKKIVNR